MAGGNRGGGHRRQFCASCLAHDLDRILDGRGAFHDGCDGGTLAVEPGVVDTGAATDPRRRVAAEQCPRQRGGGGRVADADLAEHEQVGVERVDGGDRLSDDIVEPRRRHRGLEADVAGRAADADVDRVERRAD